MATVDMTVGTAGFAAGAPHHNAVQVVSVELDFAAAATAKGSALAANDVIEVLDLPAGCFIFGAGAEVLEAMTGTSTDLTLDLGITTTELDAFIDGWDFDAASVGDLKADTPDVTGIFLATADTLDIEIQTQTGTFTGGKIRVFAVICDTNGPSRPGVAGAGT